MRTATFRCLLVFALFLTLALTPAVQPLVLGAQAQTVLYVDSSATAPGDGSSWQSAFPFLQDALDRVSVAAHTGDTAYEIRIAAGTYYPDEDQNGDHATDDPAESFRLTRDKVKILGGYPSGGGQRDIAAHRTTLSGDIDQNDEATGSKRGNSYHVVLLDGTSAPITTATVLDGLVITAGNAVDLAPGDRGGGLYCDGSGSESACSPAIVRSTFTDNFADLGGGALYNDGSDGGVSSPLIVSTLFSGNAADLDGGALYNDARDQGTSSPTIAGVAFSGNVVTDNGGAIHNNARRGGTSSPIIVNVTFSGNAAFKGGAISNEAVNGGTSEPQITNAILFGNRADDSGTAIHNTERGAVPVISHSVIEGGRSAIAENSGSQTIDDGHLLDVDPQFVAPFDPIRIPVIGGGDLHLEEPGAEESASPAIDAGSNDAIPPDTLDLDSDGDTTEPLPFDLAGSRRIQDVSDASDTGTGSGPIVDLGAYEADNASSSADVSVFTIAAEGGVAMLDWETGTERRNRGFEVQYRADTAGAAGWQHARFIESKAQEGTSAESISYTYSKEGLSSGRYLFRLRFIGSDDREHLSSERTVRLDGPPEAPASHALSDAYPNPFSPETGATVDLTVQEPQTVTVDLYDALGRKVASLYRGEMTGSQKRTFKLEGQNLSSGVYLIHVVGETFVETKKVLLVR